MTEPPGIPSVLGIESVEWLAEGGENLTVHVTGRWRRRRPAASAQPVLVVEAAGRRFRFPAMPEPPSLSGTGPGMWRISFAVPAALAPELGGRIWLQVGAVVVPLPPAVEPGPQAEPATREEPLPPTGPPSSEVELEQIRRNTREAGGAIQDTAARVTELEGELSVARREAERLEAELKERERTRRAAEQMAHAEQALRRDLARQLAARDRGRERVQDQLRAAEERVRELEVELGDARRRGDEAEQLAAAAVTARQRVERRAEEAELAAASAAAESAAAESAAAEPAPAEPTAAVSAVIARPQRALELERTLIDHRIVAASRVPAEPPAPAPAPARETMPPAPVIAAPSVWATPEQLVPALRHELEARVAAEGALRARLVAAEAALGTRVLIERRTSEALGRLRQELDGLRSAFERERGARQAAEQRAEYLARELSARQQRTEDAHTAIEELRQALSTLRLPAEPPPASPPSPTPAPKTGAAAPGQEPAAPPAPRPEPTASSGDATDPGGVVEPERLNDARQRLRAAIAPRGPETDERTETVTAAATRIPDDERTERSWLAPIWSSLTRADPVTAGRLLIELLPAQREAYPHPVAYDLVFGEGRGCAQVTVSDGPPAIRHAEGPRPREEADFQVLGSPAAIARMLTAGAFRRRFGRGIARVGGRRGRRDRVEALRSLPAVTLDLRGLHRIGVRLDPELALRLVALMIDPSWTAREQFAVAYAVKGGPTWYLLVRGGAPVQVTTDAPAGRVATTIEGPADAAALVLSGERTDEVMVTGEDWPLALLRKWIKRAQSG